MIDSWRRTAFHATATALELGSSDSIKKDAERFLPSSLNRVSSGQCASIGGEYLLNHWTPTYSWLIHPAGSDRCSYARAAPIASRRSRCLKFFALPH